MYKFLDQMETFLTYTAEFCTVILEFFGIVILVFTALRCFFLWLRHKESSLRLDLAQGIALSLEFKMGSEVLRTVVVRNWEELCILGAVILLRGILTFLIHWEIKNGKNELSIRSQNDTATTETK